MTEALLTWLSIQKSILLHNFLISSVFQRIFTCIMWLITFC